MAWLAGVRRPPTGEYSWCFLQTPLSFGLCRKGQRPRDFDSYAISGTEACDLLCWCVNVCDCFRRFVILCVRVVYGCCKLVCSLCETDSRTEPYSEGQNGWKKPSTSTWHCAWPKRVRCHQAWQGGQSQKHLFSKTSSVYVLVTHTVTWSHSYFSLHRKSVNT